MEEREVLPLIDKHLTEKEWKKVGGSGLKKMSFAVRWRTAGSRRP